MVINIPTTEQAYVFSEPTLKQMMKVSLARKEGREVDFVLEMAKVIKQCCQENLDINPLTIFDVHFMFIRLQGENARLIDPMQEDFSQIKFEINEEPIVIQCKPPTVGLLEKVVRIKDEDIAMFEVVDGCIDTVTIQDQTVSWKEEPEEEKLLFLDTIPENAYDDFAKYFLSRPVVEISTE